MKKQDRFIQTVMLILTVLLLISLAQDLSKTPEYDINADEEIRQEQLKALAMEGNLSSN